MSYAVLEVQGKQYIAKPGDQIVINGEHGKVGDAYTEVRTLLIKDKKIEIGKPELAIKAKLTIVKHQKSQKIRVATYRSKSRYRKVRGHRQDQTVLEVVEIGSLKAAPKKAKPVTKKAPAKTEEKKAPAKKTEAKKAAPKKSVAKKTAAKPAAKK